MVCWIKFRGKTHPYFSIFPPQYKQLYLGITTFQFIHIHIYIFTLAMSVQIFVFVFKLCSRYSMFLQLLKLYLFKRLHSNPIDVLSFELGIYIRHCNYTSGLLHGSLLNCYTCIGLLKFILLSNCFLRINYPILGISGYKHFYGSWNILL